MATHSSILAWKTPWTEEPGGLQSTGPQRVGHDGAANAQLAEQQHARHFLPEGAKDRVASGFLSGEWICLERLRLGGCWSAQQLV